MIVRSYSQGDGTIAVGEASAQVIRTFLGGSVAATEGVLEVVPGDNVTVDTTDPRRPVVSAVGGGGDGTVTSVEGATPDETGNVDLNLGTAATHSVGDFDPAGSATAAQTAAETYTDGAISAEVTRADGAYDSAGLAAAAQVAAEAYTDTQVAGEVTRADGTYDAAGAAAAVQAASQPRDSDLTAIAALSTTAFGRGLLALADAAALRTSAGLGDVATHAAADFDVSGAAAAAQAASQPVDSDLTSIAALSTTAFGRGLLALADAAALRTSAGLGDVATHAAADFDVSGAAAAAQAASQPLDSDLTAIAALATTGYGRTLLTLANQAALMALLSGASDTGQGIVELATSTEALTGTDTTRAVTPAGVKAVVDALVNSAPGALDTLGEIATQLASDESAVAALTTSVAGKLAKASNLSDLADASTARTNLGLGDAATHAAADFQPVDGDLTAIAALTTTAYGRAFLGLANQAALMALLNIGTAAGTVAAGDDSRITGAAQKANNLSDLASAGTARSNLGLGTAAVANKVAAGSAGVLDATDASTTNARTPTGHAASHGSGGSDAITVAESQVTNLTTDLAAKAPLASPVFTGNPTAPTPADGDNDTSVATTAFVQTASGLLIPKSLVDAKGDLLVGTADNTVARMAVGANGLVLTADSAQTTGVKYAPPAPEAYPFITGKFYTDPAGPPTAASTSTPTAGRFEAHPFPVGVTASFDQLAMECVASGTGQYRIGIYDSDPTTGLPKNLVADGGALTAGATGARTATISAALTRGMYWLCCLGDTAGTGTWRSWGAPPTVGRLGWSAVVGGAVQTELFVDSVATGAMPSVAPGSLGTSSTTSRIKMFARAA